MSFLQALALVSQGLRRARRVAAPLTLALVASTAVACSGSATEDEEEDDEGALSEVPAEVVAAARANLARITKEIDRDHLGNYKLEGELADQFVEAVKLEYGATPDLLQSRMKTLASMVFFSAPEVKTDPAVGKVTPFHGMDNAAFEALMTNEDTVFNHHMNVNGGSPKGVRPFSVCETKFLIGISKGENTDATYVADKNITNYDVYAKAYAQYAASCEKKDLLEWYNFRGLGGLRPSWLESNISERILRRMLTACREPSADYTQRCAEFKANRLKYRDKKNSELALRTMVYDPRPDAKISGMNAEAYMIDPNNPGAFVEDRNGDGVGEWLAPGPVSVAQGGTATISRMPVLAELRAKTSGASKAENPQTGELRDLPSGTEIIIPGGASLGASKVALPNAGGALTVSDSNSIRLLPHSEFKLADGTELTVPSAGGTLKQSAIGIKVGSAGLSFAVAGDYKPQLQISSGSTQFQGKLEISIPIQNGTIEASITPRALGAYQDVDPAWKKEYLKEADLGLLKIFPDGTKCSGDHPSEKECPILQRFYSVIDRHENFYQTYSSLDADSSNVSQQPSPLVACSVTLRASHHWDRAGTPSGGVAGFIYLMRIPFEQILTSDARSIDTLGLLKDANNDGTADGDLKAGPRILSLREIYAGTEKLDMSKVWLDIATLSNNQYSSEHEISKYGSVPAEQIEGMLVIRRPAAMGPDPNGESGEH